ncbi:iron ABC transporter substrate-binding protein [Litchfieldella qijiaojingensis]|uniref:Iron ABC transporter substrate-binding protein n=1 Tax=Litchfieldella qijiaojingensis TaxID=980347 RepID=A0ABQ2Z9X5_9GAMM|nr:iron-siderophore ABC transporter substrate-binding protein [Halomonas qijiaojingensis]GGY09427.1 iron ABC transporter substrate-binding protein [Halomonas qijiaojingensis]
MRIALLLLLAVSGACRAESTRTVEHAFGETRIEGTPRRIVTLYQGATDTAVALGIKPVGVVESWVEKPMYRYLRDGLPEGVRYLGLETQPDLESVAWLAPDLIVGTRYRHEAVYPLLSRIAPTVVLDTAYDFKAMLMLMGEATGQEHRAQALLDDWEDRVADFRSQIEAALGEAWPQEVAVVSFRSDHARLYYDGFARSILDELGFQRSDTQQHTGWGIKLTSRESIPAMDADAIFVFMRDSDPAVVETYRQWTQHPLWQNLEAARQGRVYRVDPVIWSMGAGVLAANRLLDELYAHYGLEPARNARECQEC